VIATTSEDDDAVGKAVAWLGAEDVAVSSDALIFRHSIDPKFVSYFFQSEQFRAQKRPFISGTKVRRLSSENLGRIRIPVPPLEVQHEIVKVLDNFTALEAELEAELEARRRQYEHYRDALLTFDGDPRGTGRAGGRAQEARRVRWMTLGEIAEIGTGSRNTNESIEDGAYPFFVRSQSPLRIDQYEFDEVAIITAGDGVGVGKVFHYVEGKYALHQRAYRIRVGSEEMNPKFLYHFIRQNFGSYLATTRVHASVSSLRKPMFERYPVPVPPPEEQIRIVAILDAFDALVNDLSVGLPAELRARRQQYEYYRDRLLSFPEAA